MREVVIAEYRRQDILAAAARYHLSQDARGTQRNGLVIVEAVRRALRTTHACAQSIAGDVAWTFFRPRHGMQPR